MGLFGVERGMGASPWILMVCILMSSQWSTVVECTLGWFGPNYQYKCRCAGPDNCNNTDGSCLDGAKCLLGWFGPACQYDGDDTSCTSIRRYYMKIRFNNQVYFTWIRIVVAIAAKDSIADILVYLENNTSRVECTGRSLADALTLDIFCDVTDKFQALVLSGEAVQFVCSVYVSGGRNVALKQSTTQSSTFSMDNIVYSSSLAVDGKTSGKMYLDKSCSHTLFIPFNLGRWVLTFSTPKTAWAITIYNKQDTQTEVRLKGFHLAAFNSNSQKVIDFRDTDNKTKQIYTIELDNKQSGIMSVSIETREAGERILTLCEVEVYGDNDCALGKYGLDCERDCHCHKQETCFVSTGGCRFGCAAGYQGYDCQQADDDKLNLTAAWAVLAVIGGLLVLFLIFVYIRHRGKPEDKLQHIYVNDNNRVDYIQPTYCNDSAKSTKKRHVSENKKHEKTTEKYFSDSKAYAAPDDYELDSASSDNQDQKQTDEHSYVEIK